MELFRRNFYVIWIVILKVRCLTEPRDVNSGIQEVSVVFCFSDLGYISTIFTSKSFKGQKGDLVPSVVERKCGGVRR